MHLSKRLEKIADRIEAVKRAPRDISYSEEEIDAIAYYFAVSNLAQPYNEAKVKDAIKKQDWRTAAAYLRHALNQLGLETGGFPQEEVDDWQKKAKAGDKYVVTEWEKVKSGKR